MSKQPHMRVVDQEFKPMTEDVRVWREAGCVRANVRRLVVWHSPDGYECGYGGSGPADLALNILNAFVPPNADGADAEACYRGRCSRFAARHHQAFKQQFIQSMPREGGTITAATITQWIDERRGGT